MRKVVEDNHIPLAGKYCNTLVVDNVNEKIYLYDADGTFTALAPEGSGASYIFTSGTEESGGTVKLGGEVDDGTELTVDGGYTPGTGGGTLKFYKNNATVSTFPLNELTYSTTSILEPVPGVQLETSSFFGVTGNNFGVTAPYVEQGPHNYSIGITGGVGMLTENSTTINNTTINKQTSWLDLHDGFVTVSNFLRSNDSHGSLAMLRVTPGESPELVSELWVDSTGSGSLYHAGHLVLRDTGFEVENMPGGTGTDGNAKLTLNTSGLSVQVIGSTTPVLDLSPGMEIRGVLLPPNPLDPMVGGRAANLSIIQTLFNLLESRLSGAQRTAIDSLNPGSSTLADVINALQA